jgi:glycosyltransferase involved in cell wall biosynthesis
MHVAMDATPLTGPVGGIRRYTVELSRALRALFPDDQYRLITDQPCPGEALTARHPPPAKELHGVDSSKHSSILRQVEPLKLSSIDRHWWLAGLPRYLRKHQIDIFHGTDFSVPYLPVCPTVMTVHDLSPWRLPGASDRVRRRTPWLLRLGLATMVITPTEAVRREVIEHFGISPEEVIAIHEAASSHFRRVEDAAPARPYFLFVGTLEPRKNVDVIIDAWREVRRQHSVDLVLAGRTREGFRTPPDLPGLSVLGETPEADLPRLYSNAVAALYLSSYEGFGLPVLEAMCCGTAVIASRDPAIQEVAGAACILEQARDTRAIAASMTAVLTHPDLRKSLQQRSLRRAADFSWQRTAAKTRMVYETAIRRFRG